MNKAERVILIILLVLTGVLLQLYGIVLIVEGSFSYGGGVFLLGFILYFLGRHFGDWPTFLIKLLGHSGLFLLSLALIILVVSSSAKDIANSIQPTIDYVAAYAIDDVVVQLKEDLPNELEVTAIDEDGGIMAVRHTEHHISAVQFHPESILTEVGEQLVKNFIESCKKN